MPKNGSAFIGRTALTSRPSSSQHFCNNKGVRCRDLDSRAGRRDHRVDPLDDDLPLVDLPGVTPYRDPRRGRR